MTGVLCVGIAVLDYVYKVDVIPTKPEKHRARDLAMVGGGLAANASVAVARLGGRSWLATRLGADPAGDAIVAGLEADGVDCRFARRFPQMRSPVSAILVDAAGERLVISYADPTIPADPAWLPERFPMGTRAVLGDTRWIEGAVKIFDRARAQGMPALLDGDRDPKSDEVYAAASHIAFSAQAVREIAGTDDLPLAIERIGRARPCWVAVTDGERGVWHWDGRKAVHTPAFRVKVVDTLGAGDVWHGAFALALAEGQPEGPAIRFANAVAALKCTRFGGRSGTPTRAEVETFLKENA